MGEGGEQRAHLPGVDPLLAGLLEVDAEPEVVLDIESRSASRIERLRASSQRWSSARRSDCAGSGCSAASVFSRHPVVSATFQEPVERIRRLDGKEDEIRRFLEMGVSKTAIAKISPACPVLRSTAS